MELPSEPLLRGSVATDYEQGHWRQPTKATADHANALRSSRCSRNRFVRQQITIEPLDETTLFAVFPIGLSIDDDRDRNSTNWAASCSGRMVPMAAVRLRGRHACHSEPAANAAGAGGRSRRRTMSMSCCKCRRAGAGRDRSAGGLASRRPKRCGEQAQLEPGPAFRNRQGAGARYLRESGQFEYSDPGQKRTAGVDPLEDFVTAHRRGHCEYFAGAWR